MSGTSLPDPAQKLRTSPRLNVSEPRVLRRAARCILAAQLVEYVTEMAKPEAQRTQQFRGTGSWQVEQFLEAARCRSIRSLRRAARRCSSRCAQRWLEPTDPLLTRARAAGRNARAGRAAPGRRHRDHRCHVPAGGAHRRRAAALDTDPDPLITLARAMAPMYAELSVAMAADPGRRTVQEERLAKALFAVYGTKLPPDATFTLRITDGMVSGYPFNGTIAPRVHDVLRHLTARAAEFGNKDPFTLPAAFAAARSTINMATPLQFRLDQGHHRRQQRQPGDRPRGTHCRNRVRRQHRSVA